MTYLKLFLIGLPIFAALDFIWLGLIMATFYQDQLGSIGRYVNGSLQPQWVSSILAYVFLVAGLVIFVIGPYIGKDFGWDLILWGALFGFIVYGVYEFTNHAIVANWPVAIVVVDTLWGVLLYALAGYLTATVARWLGII